MNVIPDNLKTEKGSTYQIHDDGTTTRTKAARPEHPGDEGVKPRSARTVYVIPQNANALAPPQGSVRFFDHGDGTMSVLTRGKDGNWGYSATQRKVPYSETPQVGLHPLELWDKDAGEKCKPSGLLPPELNCQRVRLTFPASPTTSARSRRA